MKGLFVLLLLPTIGHAEPGLVTQSLVNERASLFDIGMMRLETLTREFRESRTALDCGRKGDFGRADNWGTAK